MKLNHFQKKIATIKFFTIVLFTFAHSFNNEAFSATYYSNPCRNPHQSGFNYWYNRYYNPLKRIVYTHITPGHLAFIYISGYLIH